MEKRKKIRCLCGRRGDGQPEDARPASSLESQTTLRDGTEASSSAANSRREM